MVYPIKQLKKLSFKQKLRLVEDLWDDIVTHDEDVPITPKQKKELDRRHKEYLDHPNAVRTWPEVKKAILKSLAKR